jgi:hypothetical protein
VDALVDAEDKEDALILGTTDLMRARTVYMDKNLYKGEKLTRSKAMDRLFELQQDDKIFDEKSSWTPWLIFGGGVVGLTAGTTILSLLYIDHHMK